MDPQSGAGQNASRQQVTWGKALDDELSDRWFADQHYQAIGREMGISAGAVRSRATRLGLPRRDRASLVEHFDRERSASSSLRASLVHRPACTVASRSGALEMDRAFLRWHESPVGSSF